MGINVLWSWLELEEEEDEEDEEEEEEEEEEGAVHSYCEKEVYKSIESRSIDAFCRKICR